MDLGRNRDTKQPSITLTMVYAVKRIFATHVYRFDGTYYLQGDKGPIGHIITSIAARLVMIWFERQFQKLVTRLNLNILMYSR